jgi:7-cyano-7-deazaguanine reductase
VTEPAQELTILGSKVTGPVHELECFDAPDGVTQVRFTSDELTSLCPVTGQPDFSSIEILYAPRERCIESKSLKLYLWSFRDRQAFAEALAAEIARDVESATAARWIRVTIAQNVRGGIALEAVSELGERS